MRKLLNTLYVTSPDAYIHRDGLDVVVSIGDKDAGRIPVRNIQQITTFGYAGVSPALMRLCVENDVSLAFHSPSGRYLASVNGEAHGNVLLRRAQYRLADDEAVSLEIAKNMITGKLINGINVVKKGFSNHPELRDKGAESALVHMEGILESVPSTPTMGSLRGLEGDAARSYFELIDRLILVNKDVFFMNERNRRPPKDRFNALLSFVYGMLMNDVRSALSSVGLDPFVGFMHTDRPGRPSLALDMMEELRPFADRTVMRLVNLRMIDGSGFVEKESGAVLMDDDLRRTVIDAWQSRKKDTVRHPFIDETIPAGMIPYVQSMLLAKYLRGEIDGYPPYVQKR